MSIKVGVSPDSWGVWFASDPQQMPWQRFLNEVAEAGYEWIELGPYGYLPTDVPILRRELSKRGLKVSAGYVVGNLEMASAWPELEEYVMRVGELLAAFGARFLVLMDDTYSDLLTGQQTGPHRLDKSGWERLIDTTHKVADLARERFGLTLAFHPHAETHVEYEHQIEAFLEQTDPSRVSLCLDTGHVAYRGGDPVNFMRRYHHRIRHIHLKNVDRAVQKRVQDEKMPFALAVRMDIFCELSKGLVNFVALRELLGQVGYDNWATVEQCMYPAPFNRPLPIAKRTRTYLHEIGIGDHSR